MRSTSRCAVALVGAVTALSAPAAAQRRAPAPDTVTVGLRIWPRTMGDVVDLAVAVDDSSRGTLSNVERAETLRLGALTRGRHTFRLSRITVYAGLGATRGELTRTASGLSCAGTFTVAERRDFVLRVSADASRRVTCAFE